LLLVLYAPAPLRLLACALLLVLYAPAPLGLLACALLDFLGLLPAFGLQ
jgi:hypothetical protein